MTTTTDKAPDLTRLDAPRGNSWLPSLRGVGLVTRIELIRRRPSLKGWIFYGAALAVMILMSLVIAGNSGDGKSPIALELVVLMVLGTGILVSTSLAATSINGDSTEGVLAPIQMTRLTAGDLAFGKLLASWLVSVAALVTLLPFLLYAYSRTTWSVGELGIVVASVLLVVLVSTAIGLAWSSIAARAIASVSLAHITVGFLMLGTVVMFFMARPLVSETVTAGNSYRDWSNVTDEMRESPDFSEDQLECVTETWETRRSHDNRIAGLLLINPFVFVSETAPIMNPDDAASGGNSIFGLVHMGVSSAQQPLDMDNLIIDYCLTTDGGYEIWTQENVENSQFQRNPWVGLVFNVVLWVGAMTVTVNRLRVPYQKLRGGTRVA